MALSEENKKYLDDKVTKLSELTPAVSNLEGMSQTLWQVSTDWSIGTKSIAGVGVGFGTSTDEFGVYAHPYMKTPTRKLNVRYFKSDNKYRFYYEYGTATVKEKNGTHFYIELDKKIYAWANTIKIQDSFVIQDSSNDSKGIYIYYNPSNGNKKAFYSKYVCTVTEGKTVAGKAAIPVYKWYKNGNMLWFGIRLEFDNMTIPEESRKSKTSITGWIKVFTDTGWHRVIYIKESEKKEEDPNEDEDTGPVEMDWSGSTEWENSQGGYDESLLAADSAAQFNYWSQLYGKDMGGYSLKSHRSIIGLPLQFMSNVDMRVGSSTYGKQYMEDILYDMSIACIKPGGPVLNPKFGNDETYSDDIFTKGLRTIGEAKAYWDSLSKHGFGNTLKSYIFTLFKGGNARFYSFQSDYTHYTHYVNTLCHLFITYLGIGDKYYTTGSGTRKKYTFYSDEPAEIETDGGLGMGHQFGFDNAVYVYYSPESGINHSFSNSTMSSSLNDTLKTASDAAKEWGFFINAAGIEKGNGVTSFGQELAANNGSGLLGRLFGNLGEGVTTVLAGNNLSLPDIYSDSETSVHHQFKIKLASPYGDPESVFLYVLRPLARLLAFSLPRQYGPNSYMSPFIVQAFSKGQFNCQLGIVTSLSITRCGNGGESHTINHIPTELEVNLEIEDMYEKIFLSNEFFGNSAWKSILGGAIDYVVSGFNPNEVGNNAGTALMQTGMTLTATRLLFNNVGLIDFVASFCGANLNQQTHMSGWTMIWNMMKNRTGEIVSYNENDGWKFPQWEKQLNDSYRDAVTKLTTTITTIA